MSHDDSERRLRPYVARTLAQLRPQADRIVVISRTGAEPDDLDQLPSGVEFEHRLGPGHRFANYQAGLDLVREYTDFDEIVLVDDSVVGPSIPLAEILHTRRTRGYEAIGMTEAFTPRRHPQPYFIAFKNPVVRSVAFRRFWLEFDPSEDGPRSAQPAARLQDALGHAGFRVGPYFHPKEADLVRAERRLAWARSLTTPSELVELPDAPVPDIESADSGVLYADEFVSSDRLPLLRVDAVATDPYGLGGTQLFSQASLAHPELFESLDASFDLPTRRRERVRAVHAPELLADGVGYCASVPR
jgi:hypothetical protein